MRRCRLALERREVILEGGGEGLEFSSKRIDVMDDAGFDMAGSEWGELRTSMLGGAAISIRFGGKVMSKQITELN